ncbi:MAG: SIS domain-containing protein [Enterobacterales bacterium]|nr:SIS domain-containing protein [Enterobacterales bacterium]
MSDQSIKKSSLMKQEALQASSLIERQLKTNQPLVEKIAQAIKLFQPYNVMFVGRGSSDHAGTFGKYLIEIETAIPTFSAAPSVATVYNKALKLSKTLVIVVSQSGRSPDILEQTKQAKAAGALCIALVNDLSSPLVELVDWVYPLGVGQEKSVAATKSYLATIAAIIQLVAVWSASHSLIQALDQIPKLLDDAAKAPAQIKTGDLDNLVNLVVIGRGLGFAIGNEIALKMKEVCGLHAESFSSAEFLHGPATLVDKNFTLINIGINDETQVVHNQQIEALKNRGANIVNLFQVDAQVHPRIAPLAILQRFYLDIESIAVERGLDPDRPPGLKKVTQTL